MSAIANINENTLESINALEKELAAKLGKDIALVAYSPVSYADLGNDAETIAQITALEEKLSQKLGKNIVLVAFSI